MKLLISISLVLLLLFAGCSQQKKVEEKKIVEPPKVVKEPVKEIPENNPVEEPTPEIKKDDLLSDDLDKALEDLGALDALNLSEEPN